MNPKLPENCISTFQWDPGCLPIICILRSYYSWCAQNANAMIRPAGLGVAKTRGYAPRKLTLIPFIAKISSCNSSPRPSPQSNFPNLKIKNHKQYPNESDKMMFLQYLLNAGWVHSNNFILRCYFSGWVSARWAYRTGSARAPKLMTDICAVGWRGWRFNICWLRLHPRGWKSI